jgi:hypothetical protein
VPMPEQPPGVRRRKLNDDSPCSEYEIYRASSGTVLGQTRRAEHGWLVSPHDAQEWILSLGDAPHTRAMFWLDGQPGFSLTDGVLAGSLDPAPEGQAAALQAGTPVTAMTPPVTTFILMRHAPPGSAGHRCC